MQLDSAAWGRQAYVASSTERFWSVFHKDEFLMFRSDNENLLFSKHGWFDVAEHQKAKLKEQVAKMDGNRLLNTSVDDLCAYLVREFSVDIPVLNRDEIVADQREIQIDVRYDASRWIDDKSRPFYVLGTEIEITVPFDGDETVFRVQPTSFTLNPPRGNIKRGCVHIMISGTDLTADHVRPEIDKTLDQIETCLETLRGNARSLANELPSIARQAIESRRQKLLANQSLVSSLGFKIKEREDSPRTYSAPEVRRKVKPTFPQASAAPFKPEPQLSDADYEHILGVIGNMAHVMERSPSAFANIDEEDLRTHFLVQLNGHYEGQATGETFNYQGKTDILIRSDGKNIFIAECKYWSGPKNFLETIEQLLGYSSWRDTKVAVIIFSRNKDFTNVVASIDQTAKEHPNFKRDLGKKSETAFRYVFAHRDDPNRELTVTAMAFHVPT